MKTATIFSSLPSDSTDVPTEIDMPSIDNSKEYELWQDSLALFSENRFLMRKTDIALSLAVFFSSSYVLAKRTH